MSREDANLAIAITSLFVAVIATWTSVYAIRRDRADLRVTAVEAGLTNRWLTVANVGMRPVRIERLVVRRRWLVGRFGATMPIHGYVHSRSLEGATDGDLPTVLNPAASVILTYSEAEFGNWVRRRPFDILVEDAASHRYPVRVGPLAPED